MTQSRRAPEARETVRAGHAWFGFTFDCMSKWREADRAITQYAKYWLNI